MKKILLMIVIVLSLLIAMPLGIVNAEDNNAIGGFSRYLLESDTGHVIEKYRENDRHQIASMVKIMSLNLIFEEIDAGRLHLDDEVTISKHAASMGGSKLFIDGGAKYSVSDLIKGIIVVSANDATVALAEQIANSEDKFVDMMNGKANEWQLENTRFVNATGLPHDGQYSSAKDVTIMMQHLIKHDNYFDYAKVWVEDYTHPSGRITNLANTNKLIRFYEGCDGGKTGFTNDAGFCLSATAKRNDMRIVGTIIGANTSKDRFRSMSNMFNNTFKNYSYKLIKSKDELIDNDIIVRRARGKHIEVGLERDIRVLMDKDNNRSVNIEYDMLDEVKAPITKGDIVGKCRVTIDGEESFEVNLIALNDIERSSIFDDFIGLGNR